MNLHQEKILEELTEGDFLIAPDDLKEIMEDLQGEELSLEELAQVLLDGGIELEYLAAKYKTNKGDQSLLVVIACQDNLEVDWDDLARRCELVIVSVVNEHLQIDGPGMVEHHLRECSLIHLVEEASKIQPGDTRLGQLRYVDFYGHLQWAKRLIVEGQKETIVKGQLAPKWNEPHRGPLHDRRGGFPPGPTLRDRPASVTDSTQHLHQQAVGIVQSRIFPGMDGPKKRGLPISVYAKLVKEDVNKTRSVLSEWSEEGLTSILEREILNPFVAVPITRDRPYSPGPD